MHTQNIDRELYQKASEGNPNFQNKIGVMYIKGIGVIKNFQEGIHWLTLAANQKHPAANFNLGRIYSKVCTAKNQPQFHKAKSYYSCAAKLGHTEAQVELGKMFLNGIGTTTDYSKARYWFREASEQGNCLATAYLGTLYSEGKGVSVNFLRSFKFFSQSITMGDTFGLGQYGLALLYIEGKGVQRNPHKGMNLLRYSAGKNYGPAQLKLGDCYQMGIACLKNTNEAFKWYLKSA